MKKTGLIQLVNLATLVITLVVNGLANALPINGKTTGAISDQFPVYFVPAGYVFAIWGVIYLGLLAFTVYQLLPSQSENPRLKRIGWWFAIGNVANAAWILFWHYEIFAVTLALMLILLASLLIIYIQLGNGRGEARRLERLVVDLPFSIYLGWITVATVANATDVLYTLGWNGAPLSGQVWAVIMMVVATALAVLMSLRHRDVAYVAVIVWAFAGIAVKQSAAQLVSWSAVALAVIAAATALASVIRRKAV